MANRQTTRLTEPAEAVLAELHDDHVDLWKLLWIVEAEAELDGGGEGAAREAALGVVGELLRGGYARAGVPKGREGFDPWGVATDEALVRVEREWEALGRAPDIGEVVWFEITEAGERYVQGYPPAGL